MEKEMQEFLEALAELRAEMRALRLQEQDTQDAINKLINSSYLRSTLTLLREDINFRRTLELMNEI